VALAISALYELIEWWTALLTGARAEAFLGTQGDPWTRSGHVHGPLRRPHRPAPARTRPGPAARRGSWNRSVRAAFDRIAEQYAADFADELTPQAVDVERLRRFGAACPPGPVLDVGCGAAGHVGRFVADSARARTGR